MAVAQAVTADLRLQLLRQTRSETRFSQILLGIEQRERTLLLCDFGGGGIGFVAHVLGDLRRHLARGLRVVAQAQHDQRVAQAGEAESDTPLVACFLGLLGKRPHGGVEDVVEHANRDVHDLAEGLEVERCFLGERICDERGQVHAAKAAAAVRRQQLFTAGIARLDHLAVGKIVIPVPVIEEDNARLRMIVGRHHDLLPQIARLDLAVDPQAIASLLAFRTLIVGAGRGLVRQFPVAVLFHCPHEGVRDGHADIEVAQIAVVLRVDELLDVGMIAAENPHLRAAAGACRFHRLAALVEHAHVRHWAARAALRTAHQRALGPDRGKVVADSAAAAHGFRGLHQMRRRCPACRRPSRTPSRRPAARSS